MSEALEGELELETGIQVVGKLDTRYDFDPSGYFDGVVDAESAKSAVDRIRALEDMLRMADEFGAYASKFCLLEAQMYIRISNIDGAEAKLTKAKKALVEWLRQKSSEEIADILNECFDGTRIEVIKRRETNGGRQRYDSVSDCVAISEEILAEARDRGKTTLNESEFYKRSRKPDRIDESTVKAYVEYTRDRLLSNGVLGLGDRSGTYMNPSACNRDEVSEIVTNRLRSIASDIRSIKRICADTNYVVPQKGVRTLLSLVRSLGKAGDVI